jgi:hypothetical protein
MRLLSARSSSSVSLAFAYGAGENVMSKSLLFCLGSVALLVGCQSPKWTEPSLKRVEEVDDRLKMKEVFTAYEVEGGHQLVKHGLFTSYYLPSSKKYIEMTYRYGIAHGKCVIYSEEGEGVVVGWYVSGKPWEGDIQVGEFVRHFHKGKDLGVRYDPER